MSSVLEALKRMEAEEEHGAIATVGNEASLARRRAWQWVLPLAVIIAGMAGAAGGFYLARAPEPAVVSVEEPVKEAPVFRVVAPEPSVVKSPSVKKSTAPVVKTPWVVETPASEKTAVANVSQTEIIEEAIPPQPTSPTQAQPQVAKAVPAEQPSSGPLDTLRSLPSVDSSVFHLQGVRWSETPSRRIAVINGQILREGAMVDGAKLLTITADGVVLHIDGSRRFLAFSWR